jgi:hypothetical protein
MARNTVTYVIGTIALVGLAAAFVSLFPDIRRYIRIERM